MSRALGLALFSLVLLAGPTRAHAGPPDQAASPAAAPPPAAPPPEALTTSSSAHIGALEFTLASVMSAGAIGLATFAGFELARAREHLAYCEAQTMGASIPSACSFDPPTLGFVSAGLSWALSLPLLVGGGLLFARGAKLRRGARPGSAATLHLAPTFDLATRGGGARLSLHF